MRNFLRSLIVLFSVVGIVNAQTTLNLMGLGDTAQITKFAYDTFRVSKTMDLTKAENKLLVFVFDDTINAGRSRDSVVCEVGYQMGAPIISLSGVRCTSWTNCIVIDTCNTLTASKRYDPSKYGGAAAWYLYDQFEMPIRPHGQIDTIIGTTSSAMVLPFTPFWAPFVRFYVKGMTGNAHTFIRAKFIFEQRGYVNVRNQ
jgi:hypothetical protein